MSSDESAESNVEKDMLLVESLLGNGISINEAPAFRFDVTEMSDDENDAPQEDRYAPSDIQKDLDLIDSLLGDQNANRPAFKFDTTLIDSDSEHEGGEDANMREKMKNETNDTVINEQIDMGITNDVLSAYAHKTVAAELDEEKGDILHIGEQPPEYHSAIVNENQLTITDTTGNATFTVTKDMIARWEEDMKAYLGKEDEDNDGFW
jgi:hypothetical protein